MSLPMSKPGKILKFLSNQKEKLSPLLILTHDYPDPDALGSAFAFRYLAEKGFGIRSRIVYGGIIGRNENQEMVRSLKIPVHKFKSADLKRYANIALVDTQPAFGNNSFPSKRKATIVIDQHAFVSKPHAEFSLVDTEMGATSVLMAQALFEQKLEIPPALATALVYGILTDTQNLYRAQNPVIVETYAALLPLCDLKKLAKIQNPSRSKKFFETLSRAIRKASVRRGLIVSHLGDVEAPDLVSQVADFLLTYKGMQWSFCSGRYNGDLHVSLRMTSPNGRAGEILRDIFHDRGHAGGHGRIAGGKLTVGPEAAEDVWRSVEESLSQRLARRLRIPARSQELTPFVNDDEPEGGSAA